MNKQYFALVIVLIYNIDTMCCESQCDSKQHKNHMISTKNQSMKNTTFTIEEANEVAKFLAILNTFFYQHGISVENLNQAGFSLRGSNDNVIHNATGVTLSTMDTHRLFNILASMFVQAGNPEALEPQFVKEQISTFIDGFINNQNPLYEVINQHIGHYGNDDKKVNAMYMQDLFFNVFKSMLKKEEAERYFSMVATMCILALQHSGCDGPCKGNLITKYYDFDKESQTFILKPKYQVAF